MLILDARSADAIRRRPYQGRGQPALPDFTDESLAGVIGRADRPILIYCNNNFPNDRAAGQVKSVRLALNIQTFINLVGYGYGTSAN